MNRCPACGADVPQGKRFCGDCGTAAVDSASAATRTSLSGDPGAPPAPASLPSDDARFLPGTVVAGRYRIVALLGRGGMGEVFRADDLKLGQPVALKFLPEALERDPSRLERFLNEVRTGLRVTHPNVCRIYDLGEVAPAAGSGQAGQHYLSMEYVDGEDLSSLLRRIGRLPQDKAVQIARQLCAGLAAAHEQGILHRDLKPSNVMIDGRGRAKITDFGLAALAESLRGPDVRSGTPGYMAPEQISGTEATVRSDVYALGLVLYELFTGKQAFEAGTVAELVRVQQESTPASPATVVDGLDPVVERVILQCLERDPADRPASALSVAAALPGGDPLAAALEAGETPSPEMVAAAGPRGGLRPGTATTLLAVGLVAIAVGSWFTGKVAFTSHLPWTKSYDALRYDAREMLRTLGWDEAPRDSSARFELNRSDLLYRSRDPDVPLQQALSRSGQRVLRFFYRQSPRHLTPTFLDGNVSDDDPPPDPGDVILHLDLLGRLVYLQVEPQRQDLTAGPDPDPDWAALFEAAGLHLDRFEAVPATLLPPVFADTRRAWSGVLPGAGDLPVRIEAASLRGRPVYFRTVVPADGALWTGEDTATPEVPRSLGIALLAVILTLLAVLLIGAVVLAVRSLRLGRGDRRGALRVAAAVFALRMLHWLLAGHHVAGLGEIVIVMVAVCGALALAGLAWMLYVGLEPYVRRFWPEAMVSWSRVLSGRFRDPLVGRDVLLGFTVMACLSALIWGWSWLMISRGALSPPVSDQGFTALRGGRFAVGALFSSPLVGLTIAFFLTLLFLLIRIVVRKTWIAVVLMALLWGAFQGLAWATVTPSDSALMAAFAGWMYAGLVAAVLMTLLVRFGFLALVAEMVLGSWLASYPTTTDVSMPHFTTMLIGPAVVAIVAALAYRVATAGRSL